MIRYPTFTAIRPTSAQPRLLSRALCTALLGLGPAMPYTAAPALAQATVPQRSALIQFNIPAGPLDDALGAFGTAAGVMVAVDPRLTTGVSSPGLRGQYNVAEGLQALLAGTGLEALADGSGRAYRLQPRPADPGSALRLAPVTVSAATLHGVATEGSNSYASHYVSMAKGQTLREIPQSISVLTRQQIEDRSIGTLDQALASTPGIVVKRDYYNNPNSFYSRGFAMNQIQVDGSALGSYSAEYYAHNMAMYDHVEVLRGADGLFSGTGLPGGTVNLVRKQPTKEAQFLFTAAAGNWDRYRSELDMGGPVAWQGRLRGRLVGSWSDEQSFQDVVRAKDTFFYGVIETDLTPDTLLQAGFSRDTQRNTHWPFGLPRHADGSVIDIPRSRTTAARWNDWDKDTDEFFVKAEHAFSPDWRLAASVMHLASDGSVRAISHVGSATADGDLGIRPEAYDFTTRRKSFDINLQGAFDGLGGRHQVLLGADGQTVKNGSTGLDLLWNGQPGPTDVLNIFRDEFAGYPAPDGERATLHSRGVTKERGIYGRLNLQLAEPWHVILGSRLSSFDYQSASAGTADYWMPNYASASTYKDRHIWTPYLGTTLDLNDHWTAYASLTEIYQSQANRLSASGDDPFDNSPLDPVKGRNIEAGAKAAFLNGRLTGSISLYHTTRKGEAGSDPAFSHLSASQLPPNCCYVENGHIVSKGVELEMTGELQPGWQVAAGYSYNRNRNKKDGAVFTSVMPRHLFKLWSSYRLQHALDGLTLGGGVTVQSRHFVESRVRAYDPWTRTWAPGGNIPHTYAQGGYAVWDVFARYDVAPGWSLQLNINNLFDRRYFQYLSDVDRGNIHGEPRSYMLTLRAAF